MCGLWRVYSEGPPSVQVLLTNKETSDGLRIAGKEQEATLGQEWGTSGQKSDTQTLDVA